MYKALISDFDNTLVSPPEYTIPIPVANAILSFTEKGGIFTIASGRPCKGKLVEEYKKLHLDTPLILCGGAAIFNPLSETIVYEMPLPEKEAKELTVLLKKDYEILLQSAEYISSRDGKKRALFGDGIEYKSFSETDYSRVLQIDLSPFIVNLSFEEVTLLKEKLEKLYKDCAFTVVRSDNSYGMNITSLKATKHTGVLKFLEIMDLKPDEVVGCGDGYNDYPLLSACGYKVAMGDAPQELKDIADLIVPPQSEDGILEVFSKVLER